MLGLYEILVEFDFERMKITKNVKTNDQVWHIEKINDETFLTGEFEGHLELINKKDLTCLSHLKLEEVIFIN